MQTGKRCVLHDCKKCSPLPEKGGTYKAGWLHAQAHCECTHITAKKHDVAVGAREWMSSSMGIPSHGCSVGRT